MINLTQKSNKVEQDASLKTSIAPNDPVNNLRKFISEYFSAYLPSFSLLKAITECAMRFAYQFIFFDCQTPSVKNKDVSKHNRNDTKKDIGKSRTLLLSLQPALIINISHKRRKSMFTFENFKSLTGITDRDELMSAVAQVPEEDLRTALFFTLLACGKNIEINNELWRREHERK